MTIDVCPVRVGARGYEIHIGENLLEEAGRLISPLLSRPFAAIITDPNVYAQHGRRLEHGLTQSGISFSKIIIASGEGSKSFAVLESALEQLIALGVERRDMVLAFGGGVVGDLAGFASAVLRRGCRYAQIPTTLLAQVDSSVGGKTAINVRQGKNLVGAFHQPEIVLADISSLTTLPDRELRAGYAEIVKYGALGDEPFFAWLEKRGQDLLAGDATARRVAVKRSCETKAEYVATDERESGVRALLNLGHTFGHALEATFDYSGALLHGEAVAAGMCLAFDFSVWKKICPPADAERLKAHLKAVGLPTGLGSISGAPAFSADTLLRLMMQDKKVEQGSITLILVRRLGEAFTEKGVDASALSEFLKEAGAR
jgi:3-dehydroquinate synthase